MAVGPSGSRRPCAWKSVRSSGCSSSTPVNTPREGVVTPLGRYFDVHGSRANSPITVALVDDYDVVLMGVANMFNQYRDRVVVAELDSNTAVDDAVDIVLYDSFAQPESDHEEIAVLVANPRARRVVVYTWNFHPDLIRSAQAAGSARLHIQDVACARVGSRTGGGACRRDGHK